MNLRLKTFVSIQKIGDKLSISGSFGHNDIYVDQSPETIKVLSHLKDDKGLPADEIICSQFYMNVDFWMRLVTIPEHAGTRELKPEDPAKR